MDALPPRSGLSTDRRGRRSGAFTVAAPAKGRATIHDSGRTYYVPGPDEELYGVWVNPAHSGVTDSQKIVFEVSGYAYDYKFMNDRNSLHKRTVTIFDKWTDARGRLWYREFEQCPGFYTGLQLIRIRGGGEVLELVFHYTRFPEEEELDPSYINYRVYHRLR